MRRQKWKKWVVTAMATGMLVSQLEVLSVQAEEGQDTEAVTEEFREVSGEKVVTEKIEELFEGATVIEGADEISENEVVTEVTEELSGKETVQVSMDAFDYTIDWYNKTIWITHVNQYTDETTKTVTIPATIENMPVTKIGYDESEQGILGCGDGEEYDVVVYDSFFPQGVHIINLPDSLLEIGYATFAGLPEGVQFTIPTGVTKVGSYAFASCDALTELPYLPNVTTIWQFTYANCKNLQEAVIPQGVTYIGEYAFAADYALTEVNFPDTLQIIDKYAFSGFGGCPITMLKLPESLLRIREGAFRNVPITSLTIPSKVWEIGIDAFGYNEHLTTVKIEGQVDEFNGFAGCGNLKELTISARQVFAGSTVFSPLETIVLKENVKKVSEEAFWLKPGADIYVLNSECVLGGTFGGKIFFETSSGNFYPSPEYIPTFYGYNGSTAEEYARKWNYNFVALDAQGELPTPIPTPVPTPAPTPTPIIDEQVRINVNNFVSRMYTVALNRDSEPAGQEYWTNRLLNHETDGAGIAHGFIMSEEFQNRNLTDEEFVDVLYRTFFDREEGPDEQIYWLSKLAAGNSRGYVLSGFVNSVEFDTLCDSFGIIRGKMREDGIPYNPGIRPFVERQYTKVLNRAGEKEGINYWTDEIISGRHTPEDVAKKFFQSEEFINRNLNDSDYVETLYETFLDRPSETEGKVYWLQQISAGMDRNTVLEGFSKSPEFADILAGYGL